MQQKGKWGKTQPTIAVGGHWKTWQGRQISPRSKDWFPADSKQGKQGPQAYKCIALKSASCNRDEPGSGFPWISKAQFSQHTDFGLLWAGLEKPVEPSWTSDLYICEINWCFKPLHLWQSVMAAIENLYSNRYFLNLYFILNILISQDRLKN